MSPHAPLIAALAALSLGAVAQDGAPAGTVAIGDVVPELRFRNLVGGDGRLDIAQFRGQPVLIVNWTDTDFGRGSAREAEKIAATLVPKGLVCILRDTHNRSELDVRASAMRLFPGSPMWLTTNIDLPFDYEDNGPPPDIALVGVDGTVLTAGSYTADLGRAGKLAKAELKKRSKGWGESATAKTARKLAYGKGDLAGAWQLVGDASEGELAAVAAELAAQVDSREASVAYLMENGEPARAREVATALVEAVAGHGAWSERAAALVAGFASEDAARELALDGELGRLLKPLAKREPKANDAKKLRAFADENAGTKVAARAGRLAAAASAASGN